MTRTLQAWRTAGKPHPCQSTRGVHSGCVGLIPKGGRYCRSALPPGDDTVGNTNWWRMNLCGPCANFYGYHDAPREVTSGADPGHSR